MRPLTSPSPRWARLAVPAAALLAVIAGPAAIASAAAMTAHAGPAPARAHTATTAASRTGAAPRKATFTWHAITLINGWQPPGTTALIKGKPAYAIRDGVVYLRGALQQPTSGGTTFAVLPKSARPAHNLYIQVFTTPGMPGVLYISSTGAMSAYDGNASELTSLTTVSYRAAGATSHRLSLRNGWKSSQSQWQTGNPAYVVSHGVVYLSGSLHTAGTKKEAFVLPRAARPAHRKYVSVYTFGGSTGWLEIRATGEVDIHGPDAAGYTSLASISFPAAGTKWHAFKLVNGWKSGAHRFHTAAPEYAVVNGVVYLTGSIYNENGGASVLWGEVPAAVQPKNVVAAEVETAQGSAGAVGISGNLAEVTSQPFTNAQAFTSLAGVEYPLSS